MFLAPSSDKLVDKEREKNEREERVKVAYNIVVFLVPNNDKIIERKTKEE